MKLKTLALPVALSVFCATSASATTITVEAFDYAAFNNYTAGAVIEDFENLNLTGADFEDGTGNVVAAADGGGIWGEIASSISTDVGTFTTAGGTGSGSTCQNLDLSGNNCDNIALQFDDEFNGQGNITPIDGAWSLNAADTNGIIWTAGLNGLFFNQIVFALQDAADQGATITIEAGGESLSLSNLVNNNRQLFVVSFGTAVDRATIGIANDNGRVNDSFNLDGAAITQARNPNLPPVPLPAGAWLMLTGLGGLALARRRRKAA